MPRLLIAASGTGGHILPAISVADALPENWEVYWLGVPDRLEVKLVPKKFRLKTICVSGLYGTRLQKLRQLIRLFFSIKDVCQYLIKQRVDVVFTTGGYIAAPTILGAIFCRKPVILHESNAVPGRVTRLLGRFCNLVALGLPSAANLLHGSKTILTGTPVRQTFSFKHQLPDWVPSGSGPLLLIMGGSQGALGINNMVAGVMPDLLAKGCRVVHLTGENDSTSDHLDHPKLVQQRFSEEIPALLQHADLVVSRAGASALSELAVSGSPAILVPYPHSTDNHQEANANCAAQLGGAVIIHEDFFADKLLKSVLFRLLKCRLSEESLFDDPLKIMRVGMKKLAFYNANKLLVGLIRELI